MKDDLHKAQESLTLAQAALLDPTPENIGVAILHVSVALGRIIKLDPENEVISDLLKRLKK